MSDFKHKPGAGSMLKNDYKEKDNQPDYKGKVILHDGTEQQVALWIKDGANGKFFSMQLSDVYKKPDIDAEKEKDDLPF